MRIVHNCVVDVVPLGEAGVLKSNRGVEGVLLRTTLDFDIVELGDSDS